MSAQIIDGKALAQQVIERGAEEAKSLPRPPKLAAFLVGDDPGSHTYVRMKEKRFGEAGFASEVHRLPSDTLPEELLGKIEAANNDPGVDGILVQQPLPEQHDLAAVLSAVSLDKDVDGFHPTNLGRLFAGLPTPFAPCTPLGIIHILDSIGFEYAGKRAVVVGRSNIVGKPVAMLLLQRHCTVTMCHSRTKPLEDETGRADLLVVATGRPKLVDGSMIKPGAVVVDVGVNRTDQGLVGDVDFDSARQVASAVTPVPGGVGPLTIAMLLRNTLLACQRNTTSGS